MRSRAILLVLLVGGLAAGSGAARAAQQGSSPPSIAAAALARVDVSDVPALVAPARARDALDRDGERRTDVFAFLARIALLVGAAWWVAVRQRSRLRPARAHISARPRAPPTFPVLVAPC